MDTLSPYLITGGLIVYAQRWMKSFQWYQQFVKAVPGADRWAHRIVAAVGSLLGALGIVLTWQGDPLTGWTVTAAVPALSVLLRGGLNFLVTFGTQQIIYDMTRTRPGAELAPAIAPKVP